MKVFAVDVSICNGCYYCQIACKDEHCGNDWTPIAKPQPDTGQFWLKLQENIRGTVPKVKMYYLPYEPVSKSVSTHSLFGPNLSINVDNNRY